MTIRIRNASGHAIAPGTLLHLTDYDAYRAVYHVVPALQPSEHDLTSQEWMYAEQAVRVEVPVWRADLKLEAQR